MRATSGACRRSPSDSSPDILHAHSPVLNAIPALRVGKRLGIPVVYEVRAFWEDAAVDHGTTTEGSLRYRATRALETWALKRADHVTPSAKACAGHRRARHSRGQGHGDPERRRHREVRAIGGEPTPSLARSSASRAPPSSASSARSTPTKASTCCSMHSRAAAAPCRRRACCSSAAARRTPR
jgi:hypothetical protein